VVIVTGPGQEAQVDYGTGPMVRDPETHKCRRTRLFVMTLGCSRKSVRLLTFRSSARIWAELHERAFRRLGGATRIVVLDFVPGNKIQIMCLIALCGRGGLNPRQLGRSAWRSEHNSYSDSSHFTRSASLRHPPTGRHAAGRSTGGKHAATAACLVRSVISA
jgi:hypothetical protein